MSERDARPWMIYGAYGVTGRMIAEAALRRGHRPILAGRDPEKLMGVARTLGLPSVAVSLDQPASLCTALRPIALVIHAAGPFAGTGRPMLEACLATRTPYLDVSGEAHYQRTVEDLGSRARAAGIPLLTAAGFGATYGDCLARYVVDRLPDATHLRLSVAAASAYRTPAVQRSVLSVLAGGGGAIIDGAWASLPLAHETWAVRHAGTSISFAAAPMPELRTALLSTGVANIVAGRPMSHTLAWLARLLTPSLRGMLRVPALRRQLERGGEMDAADAEEPVDRRSRIWAEASNANGGRSRAFVETTEGYAASALAAVVSAESLLDRRLTGALTPAMAFGADFLSAIPDTRLVDLDADAGALPH